MTGTADDGTYTIDELATLSRVPSRTIRFYQSEGALPKPTLKGRVAYYGPAHLERLQQITQLQDRGLQIKAIRDVLGRAAKGEFSLQEWLGTHDQLASPWDADRPKVMTEPELASEVAANRPGLIGDLVRMGAIEKRGDAWLVHSPALFAVVLRLEKAGMPMELVDKAFRIMQKQLARLADDLAGFFIKNAEDLGDVNRVYEELRPAGLDAVRIVFAREMERALRAPQAAAAFTRGTRKKR